MEKVTNIEQFTWNDIFNQDPLKTGTGVVIVLVVVYLIKIKFYQKSLDAFTHMVKGIMYSFVVLLIYIAIKRAPILLNQISLFTGFTILFSLIEAVDNFGMAVIDILGTSNIFGFKNDLEKEEKRLRQLVILAQDIQFSLRPGEVAFDVKNKILEFDDLSKKSSFFIIEKILSGESLEDDITTIISSIKCDRLFHDVARSGGKYKSVNLNMVEELKNKFEKVLVYEREYQKAKYSIINNKIKERYVKI